LIILTGASGGIGQAILPMLGEDIMAIYNKTDANIKVGQCKKQLDLTNTKDVKEFVSVCSGILKHITLIHLAAVKIDELAVVVDEANWDKVMDVNLKGNFLLTRELLPLMIKEKWGRIIHIISSGLGDVGTLTYSTSKFGLLGMSEVLAKEYARYGITSNILQLGYFQTGMWEKLSQVKKDQLLNQIPSKKLGDPINIVNAIRFIIDSPFVNGSVVNIDGGV